MSSSTKLHAFLLLVTIVFLGVATVGFVNRPRKPRSEERPGATAPPPRPPSATVLDSGGTAAVSPASTGGAHPEERARPAAVVVPPALALAFEKRYRDMAPDAMQSAYRELGAKLRAEVRRGASEDSLKELRCEVAWLTERMPRKEE
jgi:hypothetical protein